MRAFAYFDGVPTEILYDNTKLVVASFLGDGERRKTRAFSGLQSHSLFAGRFGRPGRGSDKGYVENLVGYARRQRAHTETLGDRLVRDRSVVSPPLPAARFEACAKTAVRVSSISLVCYRANDCSAPTEFGQALFELPDHVAGGWDS